MGRRLAFAAGMAFGGIFIVAGRSDYFAAALLAGTFVVCTYLATQAGEPK